MKLLLISKIPSHLESFRRANQHFPPFQAQSFWFHALKELKITVAIFLYSDTPLFPHHLATWINLVVAQKLPTLYQKYRLFKSHYYYLFPDNWIRSFFLLYLIDQNPPDIIFVSGGISELVSFPFKQAMKKGCPIVLLHGEHPSQSATGFERRNLHLFSHIFVNDPIHAEAWRRLGAHRVTALPYAAADPNVHRRLKLLPPQKRQFSTDVVFIGTLFPDRQQLLVQLIDKGFSLGVYGQLPQGVSLLPKLAYVYHHHAWGKQTSIIYNVSKIALNLIPPHMPNGGNMRTFEIPACGTLQMANRCPEDWFTPGKEIVLFQSLPDLKKKINYYLSHEKERKKIADAGYKRVHRDHTYEKRFKAILKLI